MAAKTGYGALPFSEQIAFFKRKLNLPTASWTDVYSAEHDWAFVVAGANRNDLVADFRTAIEKSIQNGGTLEQFRAEFDEIVKRYGWDYNGGRNWRSRTIYETNHRSSYQAGRYNQLMALRETMPYWEYVHSHSVEHPRELHLFGDGLILLWNDPWWNSHFPINAWGCQCGVFGRSDDDLRRMGKSGADTAPPIELEERIIGKNSPGGPRTVLVPKGIDPGFEYTPGKSRLNSQVPPPASNESPLEGALPTSASAPGVPSSVTLEPLPTIRELPAERLLELGQSEAVYVNRFLNEFKASIETPVIYRDVLNEPLVIGPELFTNRKTGQLKVTKRGRERYLLLLADALKSPDEIWTRVEWYYATQQAVVRRRYIARFNVEGSDVPALAVFEVGSDGWLGVTTFAPDSIEYLEQLRFGVRIYRRD